MNYVTQRHQGRLVVKLPIRTVSESNSRGHWAKKAGRAKAQRNMAALVFRGMVAATPLPVTVTLVRIAPRALDDDNLRGAFKAIRDGIADAFGVDDRDPRIEWRYAQRRGGVGVYAVEVAIESTAAMAIAGTTFGQDAFSNAERPVRRLRVVKAATGQ
jgi:hypothetical protein